MDIIKKATLHVNPNQIPVITLDQPLYAIAKKVQWTWPNDYGETCYVVLLGGLHIEMSFLKVIGDWLQGSGWVELMTKGGVCTEGRITKTMKGFVDSGK